MIEKRRSALVIPSLIFSSLAILVYLVLYFIAAQSTSSDALGSYSYVMYIVPIFSGLPLLVGLILNIIGVFKPAFPRRLLITGFAMNAVVIAADIAAWISATNFWNNH